MSTPNNTSNTSGRRGMPTLWRSLAIRMGYQTGRSYGCSEEGHLCMRHALTWHRSDSPPGGHPTPWTDRFELVQELTSIFDEYQDITERIVQLERTVLYQRRRLGRNLEQWIDHLGASAPTQIRREFNEVEAGPSRPPRQRSPLPTMPPWLLEDDELARIAEPPLTTGLDVENQQVLLLIHEAENDVQFEQGRVLLGLPPRHPLVGLTTRLVEDLHRLRSSVGRSGSGATPGGTTPSTACPDGSTSESGHTIITNDTNQASTSATSPLPDPRLDPPKPSPAEGAAAPITGSSTAPTIAAPHAEYPNQAIDEGNAPRIRYGSRLRCPLSPMEMQGITTLTQRPFEWP
ncbi:hypothetical protein WOLCODRAFT_159402 [Wolfiporia cocos MD-104 SS10]|uniref:Uncharacterized protein n=1 Tax=Wolfiporia cocos (strain MD-104) TaxID=742152 RepID=A0A2H3JP80_WOLCO|nr:hypothetical protein WOLCODRAFT_159402 [Wolfiporia cocos MD-104 SS10]